MAVNTLDSSSIQGLSGSCDSEERVRENDWYDGGQAVTNKSHNQVIETSRECDVTREQSE
jgi:hypothetical protein